MSDFVLFHAATLISCILSAYAGCEHLYNLTQQPCNKQPLLKFEMFSFCRNVNSMVIYLVCDVVYWISYYIFSTLPIVHLVWGSAEVGQWKVSPKVLVVCVCRLFPCLMFVFVFCLYLTYMSCFCRVFSADLKRPSPAYTWHKSTTSDPDRKSCRHQESKEKLKLLFWYKLYLKFFICISCVCL